MREGFFIFTVFISAFLETSQIGKIQGFSSIDDYLENRSFSRGGGADLIVDRYVPRSAFKYHLNTIEKTVLTSVDELLGPSFMQTNSSSSDENHLQ
jgi:hypothetical protein